MIAARKSITKKRRPTRRQPKPTHSPLKAIVALAIIIAIGVGIKITFFHADESDVLADMAIRPTSIDPNFDHQVQACFLPVAKAALGLNLDITSGFRSDHDQDILYAQGRTEPGDIVTQAKGGQSIHNYGLAVDVVEHTLGYDIDWDKLGKVGIYCGLEHGDRGYEDLPHFQHVDNLSWRDLENGQHPKPLTLPCALLETRYKNHQALTKKDLQTCHVPKF